MNSNPDNICAVPKCTGYGRELPIISNDPVRAKEWLAQIGIPKDAMSGKVMVCKVHFDILMNNRKYELRKKMTTEVIQDEDSNSSDLLIPTTSETCTYEANEAGPSNYNLTKRKGDENFKEVQKNKKKPKVSNASSESQTGESTQVYEILNMLQDKSLEFREQVGLHLHLRNPLLYKRYHKTIDLPSIPELKNVFEEDQISFQKNAPVNKKMLIMKVGKMTNLEKQCVLCISEVKVKPNLYYDVKFDKLFGFSDIDDTQKPELANLALVLTVQGIYSEWKQIVSVVFVTEKNSVNFRSHPNLKLWITQNIRNLFDIGLNVVGFVSQSSYDLSPENKRYFHVTGYKNKKIVYLYDITYLFKQFYSYFLISECSIQSHGTAEMQHILDYYKVDKEKEKGERLTPKLTERHFEVTENIENISIKHVKEVISLETAQAMAKCIDAKLLTKSAKATIQLITMMRMLFDMLHSNNLDPLVVANSAKGTQKQVLYETIKFLQNIKLTKLNSIETVPKEDTFLELIPITIVSILTLYDDIKLIMEFRRFPTKQLSLANVTKFFDRIRKKSKNGSEPTSRELFTACKNALWSSMLKPVLAKDKETIDAQEGLGQISNFICQFKCQPKKGPTIIGKHINIMCSDYNTFKLKRRDDVLFIAGFVLKKCFDRHQFCSQMKEYIISIDRTSSIGKLINDEGLQDVCLVPHEKFIDFIEMMEIMFRSIMTSTVGELSSKKLLSGLLGLLLPVTFPMPCECFPLLFAKKLYLRIRIFNMLKYNRRLLKAGKLNFVI